MAITMIDINTYQKDFSDTDQDFLLVDVREVDEYQDARIPGAINIPLSQFQGRTDEIPDDKPLVLVCRSSGRSVMAADYLDALGYQTIYVLSDGTMGWLQQGLPTEQG